jgi:hypothetical protein
VPSCMFELNFVLSLIHSLTNYLDVDNVMSTCAWIFVDSIPSSISAHRLIGEHIQIRMRFYVRACACAFAYINLKVIIISAIIISNSSMLVQS